MRTRDQVELGFYVAAICVTVVSAAFILASFG
jgi:hypothetical protein